jgi:hypothetical protein
VYPSSSQRGGFRRSLFVNAERVSLAVTRVRAQVAALNLALADLRAAPSGRLRLSGSQNQFRGRRGDHRGGLIGAVDGSQLGDGLKAEHDRQAALAPTDNQLLQLRLASEHRELVGDDPDLFTSAGPKVAAHQSADDASSHTLCNWRAASFDSSEEVRKSQPRRFADHSSALQLRAAFSGR